MCSDNYSSIQVGYNFLDKNAGANNHLLQTDKVACSYTWTMNEHSFLCCRVWKQISKTEASLTIPFQVSVVFNKVFK